MRAVRHRFDMYFGKFGRFGLRLLKNRRLERVVQLYRPRTDTRRGLAVLAVGGAAKG